MPTILSPVIAEGADINRCLVMDDSFARIAKSFIYVDFVDLDLLGILVDPINENSP